MESGGYRATVVSALKDYGVYGERGRESAAGKSSESRRKIRHGVSMRATNPKAVDFHFVSSARVVVVVTIVVVTPERFAKRPSSTHDTEPRGGQLQRLEGIKMHEVHRRIPSEFCRAMTLLIRSLSLSFSLSSLARTCLAVKLVVARSIADTFKSIFTKGTAVRNSIE